MLFIEERKVKSWKLSLLFPIASEDSLCLVRQVINLKPMRVAYLKQLTNRQSGKWLCGCLWYGLHEIISQYYKTFYRHPLSLPSESSEYTHDTFDTFDTLFISALSVFLIKRVVKWPKVNKGSLQKKEFQLGNCPKRWEESLWKPYFL